MALHDYAAKTSSDLSFRQGDRILMTKHLDEKWSCGKLNGREGMFPRIYVQTVIGTLGSSLFVGLFLEKKDPIFNI